MEQGENLFAFVAVRLLVTLGYLRRALIKSLLIVYPLT